MLAKRNCLLHQAVFSVSPGNRKRVGDSTDLERQIALDREGDVDTIYWGPEAEAPSELSSNTVEFMLMAVASTVDLFGVTTPVEVNTDLDRALAACGWPRSRGGDTSAEVHRRKDASPMCRGRPGHIAAVGNWSYIRIR